MLAARMPSIGEESRDTAVVRTNNRAREPGIGLQRHALKGPSALEILHPFVLLTVFPLAL
jgi:hypothetical protein